LGLQKKKGGVLDIWKELWRSIISGVWDSTRRGSGSPFKLLDLVRKYTASIEKFYKVGWASA